ncbi:MAG: hypothetical protein Q4D77_00290 [Peptostreptococcaceae bacterium]|nr:hypothetical protein [Peptostreptococcaceae bacterium]
MTLFKKKREEDVQAWGVSEYIADLEKQMIAYNVPSLSEVESDLRVEINKFLNAHSNTHDLLSSPLWLKNWIRKWLDLMLEDLTLDKINNETLLTDRSKANELQLQQVEKDLLLLNEEIQMLETILNKSKGGM